ncbi:MAG TPA: uroporphyrinogen-III C-methyltransferase [Thiopseudomonas sp.]|nr:uroporphyrinogen-III C-methyltransferase [Thiopseudomonas sp.]
MSQASDKPDAKADSVENKNTAATSTPAAQPTTPSQAQAKSSSGKGLAVLALLFGLGGLGAGVWSVLQIQAAGDSSAQQQQQLSSMLASTQAVNEREQQLRAQIEKMPSATQLQQGRELLASVQAEQQLLSQRLETILGASRQDWRLAEAEHLLRMASLRLSALHDTHSASFLLQAADHILMEQNDPAAFAAREQLARSITALRSSGSLDRTGLFVKLGALYQQANQLTALAPGFTAGKAAATASPSRWEAWWDNISRYVRIDFNASEQVQPLLAGQSLTQVRLAIGLALEQAQWAALNGAEEVYQQALQQAVDILDAHFSAKDPNVAGLRTQISELHEQKVRQELPDLTAALTTLQAYINKRSAPQESDNEESN